MPSSCATRSARVIGPPDAVDVEVLVEVEVLVGVPEDELAGVFAERLALAEAGLLRLAAALDASSSEKSISLAAAEGADSDCGKVSPGSGWPGAPAASVAPLLVVALWLASAFGCAVVAEED